jgi:ATP-dependent Clp protease ATP-binding subunit ClpA
VTQAGFEAAMAGVERRSAGPPGEVRQMAPTTRARKAIELAFQVATEAGQHWIGTHHLLLGVLAEGHGVAVRMLAGLGAGPDEVRGAVAAELDAGGEPAGGPRPSYSPRLWQLMHDAEELAALEGAAAVESEHVRLAIADAPALVLARTARDLQARRQDALEGADHEAAARLRAEEAALRERLQAALAEWRRTAG